MKGGKMRVGERPRRMPALSPKKMRLTEDASRESMTPFNPVGKVTPPSPIAIKK